MAGASWNGPNLTDLNNYMKNYPSGIIIPEEFMWNTLYDALKANFQRKPHVGDNVEILVMTSRPYTGKGWGENIDIPYPDDLGFAKAEIPLREVISNNGITRQAMQRAIGGDSSWGRAVDLVLREGRTDFLWTMELGAMGAGNGALARVVSAADAGGVVTVTCDNTYTDFGIENVGLLKKGMWVEIYDSGGTVLRTTAGGVEVTAVTFGSRNNAAATTGTFTFTQAAGHGITDNDVVYIQGAVTDGLGGSKYSPTGPMPMGLIGLVQGSGDDYSGANSITTFQGLTRSSYPTLQATVYQASDFDTTDGSDGTPNDWSLSVLTDAINTVNRNTGGVIDVLLCSSELAMCIDSLNRAEAGVTVNVGSTTQQAQPAAGLQLTKRFIGPNGENIPIIVSRTIPRNVLYGLTTEDLTWYAKGDFDFLRLEGRIWDKSYNDRKANYEAPYGGYAQVGAQRCDRCFCIQDLKDDL